MKKNSDLVVAVLLNYNQNEYSINCVESLLESDYEHLKILIIDNGSTKENASKLEEGLPRSPRVTLKKLTDNIGYAQGTNYALEQGLKFAPSYFLIINNDTIIDKKAVTELVLTSKKYNDKARITGKVYHFDKPDTLQFIAFKYLSRRYLTFDRVGVDEKDEGQYDHLEEIEMMDDIFVLQPVELYRKIGGYSTFLWVNGVNIDISLRAIHEGYKLVFSPKAKIWHKGSVSIGGRDKNPRLAFWSIQSKLIIRYLHLNKFNFGISYLSLLFDSALRTYVKSIYLKNFKDVDQLKYARSKLEAFAYFHAWVGKKNNNTGYYPYE
jgi:GT2 family glycosyltransferase